MGHFGQSSYQGESDEGNDAPDDPGDGPLRPRADAGAVVAGEEAQFAARCDEVRQADRQEYLLMREWLSACLEPSMFVSMPFLDDGHKKVLFAQVLAVNPIVKTVEMFKEEGNEDNQESFKIAVQAYDTWAQVNFGPGALGDHADMFTMSEPTDVDSIKDLAATPGDRAMYFRWLAEESDVELCTHLWQPRHLAPPRSWTLGHPRLLTLCLLGALPGMGFVGEACVTEHDPETIVRCVIAAAGLFAAGVTSFKSNRSTAFYAYLLRHSKLPPHGVTTKQLQVLVQGTNSEEQPAVQEALNESVTSAAPWKSLMEINRDEAAEIPVAGATGGGDAVPMPEPVDDVHPVVVDEVDADEAAWPEILEGVRLLKRKGKHDSGWSYFDRLAVSCPNPDHVRCSRSRSVALQMDVLGRNAPLCFLGVWLQVAWLTEAEHRACMPDIGSMRLYKDAAGI